MRMKPIEPYGKSAPACFAALNSCPRKRGFVTLESPSQAGESFVQEKGSTRIFGTSHWWRRPVGVGIVPPRRCSAHRPIRQEVGRVRLFPFHRSAKVAESADRGLPSHFHAQWQQACYFLSRLRFHLAGALSYAWNLPAWNKKLRSIDRSEPWYGAHSDAKAARFRKVNS